MIIARIYDRARLQPAKPAAIINGSVFSYASFARAIEVLRQFLERQSLPAGCTAVVLAGDPLDAWIFTIALRAVGLNTIGVRTLSEAEALKAPDVGCIVSPQQQTVDQAFKSPAFSRTRVVVIPETLFANIHAGDLPFYTGGNRPFGGNIIYSSGTTGAFKKMMMGGSNEAARNQARAKALFLNERTVYHCMEYALWAGLGFKNPAAVWHVGGCVVFDRRPDRFNYFFQHGMNCSHLTPPHLKELLRCTSAAPRQDWELVATAGFLPSDVAEAALQRLTKKLFIGYGSSELCIHPMRSHIRSADDVHWFNPLPDQDIQIVDEDERECGIDQEGQIRIRLTDLDYSAYLDDPETSARVFRNGCFYSGDIAVRRADGRIRVLGRTTDVLNVQGAKIAVAPLEDAIRRDLGADEVCLFAGLNDRGVDEIVVAVQSSRELSKAETDRVTSRLPQFQSVRFSVMKAFPRGETGMRKTQRSALRKLVFSKS